MSKIEQKSPAAFLPKGSAFQGNAILEIGRLPVNSPLGIFPSGLEKPPESRWRSGRFMDELDARFAASWFIRAPRRCGSLHFREFLSPVVHAAKRRTQSARCRSTIVKSTINRPVIRAHRRADCGGSMTAIWRDTRQWSIGIRNGSGNDGHVPCTPKPTPRVRPAPTPSRKSEKIRRPARRVQIAQHHQRPVLRGCPTGQWLELCGCEPRNSERRRWATTDAHRAASVCRWATSRSLTGRRLSSWPGTGERPRSAAAVKGHAAGIDACGKTCAYGYSSFRGRIAAAHSGVTSNISTKSGCSRADQAPACGRSLSIVKVNVQRHRPRHRADRSTVAGQNTSGTISTRFTAANAAPINAACEPSGNASRSSGRDSQDPEILDAKVRQQFQPPMSRAAQTPIACMRRPRGSSPRRAIDNVAKASLPKPVAA